VYALKPLVTTELNIEGYPSADFLRIVKEVKPAQVTLVPDGPDVITSNAGWDTKANLSLLQDIIADLHAEGIRTSIFVDTLPQNMEYADQTGTDRVELYTEAYAANFYKDKEAAIASYVISANIALELGLGLNAGHDLNLDNLKYFKQNIPGLLEVSIGHALIADALYFGLENTIQLYLRQLAD
jgi:pyridoxine 5-phosphate synthase